MILNENVEWMDLPDFVRAAFQMKFSMPTKDRLEAGMILYKFNDFKSLHAPGNISLSPWWSPFNSYKHDAGWEQKLRMAKTVGISVREWGRLTSAIKENWNSLNFLLTIQLNVPVYAFFGGFSQMARIDDKQVSKMGTGEGRGKSKNLPGGASQFYIPNLTADHVSSWNADDLSNR